jgi:hypothetical protein
MARFCVIIVVPSVPDASRSMRYDAFSILNHS